MAGRRVRRRALAWVAALGFIASVLAGLGPTAAADSPSDPPDGAITEMGSLPNYFRDADPKTNPTYCTSQCPDTNVQVSVFSDPANHLIFETDTSSAAKQSLHCPEGVSSPLLALDVDSLQPLAYGCGGSAPAAPDTSTNDALVAIDPVDKLLFYSDNASGTGSATVVINQDGLVADSIIAVSETTLRPIARWSLPPDTAGGQTAGSPAPLSVLGLSWQAAGDRLVVENGYDYHPGHEVVGTAAVPPGIDIAVYDVAATMAKVTTFDQPVTAVTAAAAYPYDVSDCAYAMSLKATFGTANPLLGTDGQYLFVPCYLQGSGLAAKQGALPAGIVRLDLKDGAPDGSSTVTALPGNQDGDVYFDAVSERAFVPVQAASGTVIYVYDGVRSRLVGEDAVVSVVPGQANPDNNCVDMAFDPTTGRGYGLAPSGLFDFDGRLTAVGGGQNAADLGHFVQYQTDTVLPKDAAYPYPRVILNVLSPVASPHSDNPCTGGDNNWGLRFAVFADRTSPPGGAAQTNPDANTYDGAIPPGYGRSTSYGADASASGIHVDWAGSYGGAINNIDNGTPTNGDFLPFGGGIRDLLAGWIPGAGLTDGSPAASATPVGDGSGPSQSDLATCTDASAPFACQHPVADGAPAPPPSTGLPRTAQAWPFGDAVCPLPTPKGQQNQADANGFALTTGYDSGGNPQQHTVPGSDQGASAHVDCAATSPVGGVTADASSRLLSSGVAGGPEVVLAGATSSASLTPASDGGPTVSQTTASARGVHIQLPQGAALDIGAIVQSATVQAAGRPGTAGATRAVALSGVVVTSPDGTKTDVCQTGCANVQTAADQINAAFPGQLEVTFPEPDSPYGPITHTNGVEAIPGSAGGYQAAVQPSESDQTVNHALYGYSEGDHETSLLPALRIKVTPPQAQNNQLDYLVVDLAPVHADAFAGVIVSCPDDSYAPDPTMPLQCVKVQSFTSSDTGSSSGGGTQTQQGSPTTPAVPATKGHYVAGTRGHFVPGTSATPPTFVPAQIARGAPLTQALLQPQQPLFAGGVPGLVKRVFKGFSLLARSPAEAAKFFGLLVLFALPTLMASRQRQWMRSVEEI